jgi:hypothetical protein
VTSRLGMGKSITFFTVYMHRYETQAHLHKTGIIEDMHTVYAVVYAYICQSRWPMCAWGVRPTCIPIGLNRQGQVHLIM